MIRSFLATPASNAGRVAEAMESAADAVILDLEDAVAIDEKPAARAAAVDFLKGQRRKPIYVRVNGLHTSFSLDDLLAIGAAGPDGIFLPKVETSSDLLTVDWILGQIEARNARPRGSIGLLPIVETARGLAGVGVLAGATNRVRRFVFGAVDLALDMDLDLNDEVGALSHPRFAIALASRAAGLEGPIDTAFIDIQNQERLRVSALNARNMGYTGKCCIHPAQIAVVHDVFTPQT
jgi:citrate lyase subunit beta / citryl-CoA lyase